jgi:phage-related protein
MIPVVVLIATTFAQVLSALTPVFSTIVSLVSSVVTQIVGFIQTGVVPIVRALVPIITQVINACVPVIKSLIPVVKSIATGFGSMLSAATPLIRSIASIVGWLAKQVSSFIKSVILPTVKAMLPTVRSVINTISGIVRGIQKVISGVVNVISGIFSGDWSRVWKGFGQIASGAIDGLKSIVTGIGDIGKNLVKGLWNGISNLGGWIKDKIFGFAHTITDSIKNFFGIHSPSKLWADEVGRFLPPGIAVGVEKAAPQLYDSVDSMGQKATDIASEAATKVQTAVTSVTGGDVTGSPTSRRSAASSESQQTGDGGDTFNMYGITDPDVMAAAIAQKKRAKLAAKGF